METMDSPNNLFFQVLLFVFFSRSVVKKNIFIMSKKNVHLQHNLFFIIIMRKIIFLAMIICFISCNERVDEYLVENTLQDTKWKIDYLLCLDETRERYELTAKNDTLEFDYGNFVLFSKNKTFESYYTAWCGNDCFRTVYGKYNIIFDTKLSITVDSVYYSGWCTG
jgi:Uri superfamily endonuclease